MTGQLLLLCCSSKLILNYKNLILIFLYSLSKPLWFYPSHQYGQAHDTGGELFRLNVQMVDRSERPGKKRVDALFAFNQRIKSVFGAMLIAGSSDRFYYYSKRSRVWRHACRRIATRNLMAKSKQGHSPSYRFLHPGSYFGEQVVFGFMVLPRVLFYCAAQTLLNQLSK